MLRSETLTAPRNPKLVPLEELICPDSRGVSRPPSLLYLHHVSSISAIHNKCPALPIFQKKCPALPIFHVSKPSTTQSGPFASYPSTLHLQRATRPALPCPAPASASTVRGTLPVPLPFQNRTSLDLRKGRSAHRVEEGVLEERSLLKELDDRLDRKVKAKPRGSVPLVEGSLEDSGVHE